MKPTLCPKCGKKAERGTSWKMSDGSRNRIYIHETKGIVVKSSCVVNEMAAGASGGES